MGMFVVVGLWLAIVFGLFSVAQEHSFILMLLGGYGAGLLALDVVKLLGKMLHELAKE